MDIATLKKSALEGLNKIKNFKELEVFRLRYLGRKGELSKILRGLKHLSEQEKKEKGQLANALKNFLTTEINKKVSSFKFQVSDKELFDITAPGIKILQGHLHILTQVRQQIEEIFQSLGFSIVEGPEIETEYYNFDALNIPANHPARDLWDTFWLDHAQKIKNSKLKSQTKEKLLLRTHTSPVQIHFMEAHQPPARIIAPGRCFRHEATDASHDFQFHQVEGLMIDKNISMAHFKGVLEAFFKRFFSKDIQLRLRPSYFPFVEPGFEVDISCPKCRAKQCGLCRGGGWLEIMGAGMVHPKVFKAVGYDSLKWQGFAFGLGLERAAMIKYGINDIRLFHSGDLRFINQF